MAPPTRSRSSNILIHRPSPTTIHYSITNRPLPRNIHGFIALFLADTLRLLAAVWGCSIAYVLLRQRWALWQNSDLVSVSASTSGAGVGINNSMASVLDGSAADATMSALGGSNATFTAADPFTFGNAFPWSEALLATLRLPLEYFTNTSSTSGIPAPAALEVPLTIPLLLLSLTSALLYLSLSTTESLLVLHTLGLQISHRRTPFPLLTHLLHQLSTTSNQHNHARTSSLNLNFDLISSFASGLAGALASVLSLSSGTRFIPTADIQDVLLHEGFVGWEVKCYLAVVVRGEEGLVVVFERLLPRLDTLEGVWRGVREVLWEEKSSLRDEVVDKHGDGDDGREKKSEDVS